VVLASSKTAAEIKVLQYEMGLSHWPAIVENGAGSLGDGAPACYGDLRGLLDRLPRRLRQSFKGFGDMTVAEVVDSTGLSPQEAQRAMQRDFSEPGLWIGSDADEQAFLDALGKYGVTGRKGGRFLTLSFGATKADQMAAILARFAPRHSVALGDAPNDVEMLQTAEFGIIVANPHRAALLPLKGEESGKIYRTPEAGPTGWTRAIMALLDRLDLPSVAPLTSGQNHHG
jgi:mannosyl-3-phosphoglycerate phosphatase